MHRYRSQSPPGAFYPVDGYTMHLDCTGTGSPTLVLEAGLGDDFLSWRRVQPGLSRVTRVCSYDRAGYGWSSPRPEARDAAHIAPELHALLAQAGIGGPIVLMGHSAGGLFIRRYAQLYPQGIVAMVFIDASTPTQSLRLPAALNVPEDFAKDKMLLPFGGTRLLGDCGQIDAQTPEVTSLLREHDCNLLTFHTIEREEAAFLDSQHEALGTGPFGSMPVLIFSQDPALYFGPSPFPLQTMQQAAATWNTLQEEMRQLSPNNCRFIAKGSTHYVHQLRPELVTRHVSTLILALRHAAPGCSDAGKTAIE